MKHIIIKLSFLFVTMGVLTSSKEDTGLNKANQCLNDDHICLPGGNEYAVNISCKQTMVVQEKKVSAYTTRDEDNEISLSPISRFILLQ
jgi:hypothetical protein